MAEISDTTVGPYTATPGEELTLLVTWGSALFQWAEEGVNPGVRSYWDALHYVSTALSVGYANIFPVTPLGKAIGALVMTFGPALAARALDGIPQTDAAAGGGAATADPVLAKLDEILVELRRRNGAGEPPGE